MDSYHGLSFVIDLFYLADFICDCRFYAFKDHRGMIVDDRTLIWQRMKRHKARLVFKAILFFPFYLISNQLYCIKLLSAMHLRTMYLFMEKAAILVRPLHPARSQLL